MAQRKHVMSAVIALLVLVAVPTSGQAPIAGRVLDMASGEVVAETAMDLEAIAAPSEDCVLQWGVVQFFDPTSVGERILVGDYIIVHDEFWHSGDSPCTTVYEFESGRASDAVASASCRRTTHPTAVNRFTVLVRPVESVEDGAMWELVAFWFSGRSELHHMRAGDKPPTE